MILVILVGCGTQNNELKTVEYIDINQFMGDWYVISSIPTLLEKNIYNAIENYELNSDGTVKTTFTYNAVAGDTITDSSVNFYAIQANISVDIGHGTTAAYDFGQAFYDLELTQSTTNSKVLRGKVNLVRELN